MLPLERTAASCRDTYGVSVAYCRNIKQKESGFASLDEPKARAGAVSVNEPTVPEALYL